MLYLIGLGLGDKKDITLKGLEAIKKSKYIYLESYTSSLSSNKKELERLYKKKIILADRNLIESKQDQILAQAKTSNVAILIIGDIFFATTHFSLYLEAKKQNIEIELIFNASILSAIGITGLFLYNFGKITSIPFENKNIKTPLEVFSLNQKNNLHTLFLFDLDPKNNRYLNLRDACIYLIQNKIPKSTLAFGIINIGQKNKVIINTLKEFSQIDYTDFPQCLIIPSKKLHFIEQEAIDYYKNESISENK